jgi:hypothetical protein
MSSPYWQLQLPQKFWDRILGRERNLAHLEPVVLGCAVEPPTNQLRINVRYSMHCFTEAFDAAKHSDGSKLLDSQKKPRCFSESRYALSKLLPAMIEVLPSSRVQQSYKHGQRNYVHSTETKEQGGGIYQMFFTLRRVESAGHELEMFVESAYLVQQPRAGRGIMRFRVLADGIYRRKDVKFPRR